MFRSVSKPNLGHWRSALPRLERGKYHSLINALTVDEALARASIHPDARKKSIIFTAGERHLSCRLPGYGYAMHALPIVEKWQRLLSNFLQGPSKPWRVPCPH